MGDIGWAELLPMIEWLMSYFWGIMAVMIGIFVGGYGLAVFFRSIGAR